MSGILGEYTELFLEESEDQIEELNGNLLKLESDHSNPEIINDIFRAAHSLKSSAAFVGLYNLSDLAHKMESLLQKIREDKISVNVTLVNLLFECFDLIKSVIDAVGQGEKIDTPFTDMIEKLGNYEKSSSTSSAAVQVKKTSPAVSERPAEKKQESSNGILNFIDLNAEEISILNEEISVRNASAIDVKITLKPEVQMKGSRFALILQNLKNFGVIFKSLPEEDELLSGGQFTELVFTFITQLDLVELEKIISSDQIQDVKFSLRTNDLGNSGEFHPLNLTQEELQELDEEMKNRKGQAYDVRVILKSNTQMKGLRFTLILQNLKMNSSIFKSSPEVEVLERGTELNAITFIIVTGMDESVLRKMIDIDMVEFIDIQKRTVSINGTTGMASSQQQTSEAGQSSAGQRRQPMVQTNLSDKDGGDKGLTKSIKVSSEKLDQLMNNVGELVITNSGFQKIYDDLVRTYGDDPILGELKSKIDQINRISKDLQSGIMNTRMVPIGSVFNRFSRLVRDLSMETGKKVQLNLLGENTELDKKVVDMIGEPLLHLIRNSIDHGIESPEDRIKVGKPEFGTVELNAYQGGNNIMVEIRDDGKGLNKAGILKKAIENGLTTAADAQGLNDNDVYQFIFAPGFSTAAEITDISGRGVGMNVVNKLIQDFKGKIIINTNEGQGTSFTLCFPQALAIIPSILVSMEEEIYAFPLSEVFETIRVSKDQINTLEGHEIINLRGEVLPIYRLNRIIGLSARPDVEEFPVVIVNYNTRKLGFIVDDLIGKHETVIKTLEKNFRNIPGLTGASIMGDGTIILVLDIPGLIELSTGSLPDITSLGGKDMPRTNSARSIDSTSLALVYKTANSTNMYNSKLLEMVQSDKSKRKKEKSKQVKKAVIQERDEDIPLQLSSVQSKQEEEKTEETAPEQEVQVQEETSVHSESVTPEESSDSTISDDEHAKAKELLKSFAEQTHERVESMIDRGEVIDHSLSKAEIRKLESVVNTGMMNAGLVLSQLVGSNVELFMPEITLADKDSLALEIRDPDDLFFGLKVGMNGDLHGAMLMIFSEEKGRELASKLLKSNEDSDLAKKISDDSLSVLMEISNIVCASVINSLSNKAKSQIMPSVPELFTGNFKDVISAVKPGDSKFLSMNTEFIYEGDNLIGNLIFLPDYEELVKLIAKLN